MADLFCGAGGSSSGLARACADLGLNLRLTAVNHWDVAIATHSRNHPDARHWCMDLDQARPFDLVPERKLDIMWASPSCTEHSYAKGGNDVDDQMRASAWSVPRMAEALKPRVIIVENVPPFRNWGPVEPVFHRNGKPKLDKHGNQIRRPIKARKGETFRAWFAAIESLGYSGRYEMLNSADYGEAQTRIRFFAMFRNDGLPIDFPAPSHGKRGDSLLGKRAPWRAAREIIDWSLEGGSIFERKTPLAPNTMRRIEAGIRRYCSGALAEAFLVVLRNHADASSLNDPAPTVTAGGTHIGLAQPSLTAFVLGQNGGSVARDVDDPIPTVARKGAISVVQPFAIDVRHGDRPHQPLDLDGPIGTVTAKNGLGVVEPFIASYYGDKGGEARTRSIDEPIPTIPTENRFGVVEPFVVSYAERDGDGSCKEPATPRSVDEPLGTVITRDRFGVVQPFIVPQMGDGMRSIDAPAPTVTTTTRGMRLIEPFLTAHFGERATQEPRTHAITEPVPAVTHRGAGDLVEPVILPADASAPRGRVVEIDGKPYVLDVRFRMLQPHELARAQGFSDDYVFTGTKSDQTAQIGNAVPEKVAYALGRAALLSLGYGKEAAA